MLIPLGLFSKIKTIPWAIILIATLSIVTTIRNWKETKLYSSEGAIISKQINSDQFIKKIELCPSTFPDLKNECPKLTDKEKKQKNLYPFQMTLKKVMLSNSKVKDFFKTISLSNEGKNKLILHAHRYPVGYISELPLSSLVVANFNHSGLIHLFVNLLFIAVFGIYIEQRIGHRKTFFLGFLSGGFSIFLEANLLNHYNITLGASAIATTYMGATLIYFWKQRMKFLAFTGYSSLTFYVPIKLAIPYFFVTGDIVGIFLSTSHTANLAHLCGLLAGMIYAMIDLKRHPLKWNCIFKEEENIYQSYKDEEDIRNKYEKLVEAIKFNPLEKQYILEIIALLNTSGLNRKSVNRDNLTQQCIPIFKVADFENPQEAFHFISSLSPHTHSNELLSLLSWSLLLKVGDIAIEKHRYLLALNCYRQSIKKAPKKKVYSLSKTVLNIESFIEEESPPPLLRNMA